VVSRGFIVGLPGETEKPCARRLISPRVWTRDIQDPIAHAYPRPHRVLRLRQENALINIGMSDEQGHQLPNVIYPGILKEAELMEWVNASTTNTISVPRRLGYCA